MVNIKVPVLKSNKLQNVVESSKIITNTACIEIKYKISLPLEIIDNYPDFSI